MRNVRNITVAVPDDLYRQTRRLAADHDITVTALVFALLETMPDALSRARFPVGGPKSTPSAPPAPNAPPTHQDAANTPPMRLCGAKDVPASIGRGTGREC